MPKSLPETHKYSQAKVSSYKNYVRINKLRIHHAGTNVNIIINSVLIVAIKD